jgi:hypothetical protein
VYNVQIDDGTSDRVEITLSSAEIGKTQYSQILKITFASGVPTVTYKDVFTGRTNAEFKNSKLTFQLSNLVPGDFNRNFKCALTDSASLFANPQEFIQLKEAGMSQYICISLIVWYTVNAPLNKHNRPILVHENDTLKLFICGLQVFFTSI